MIEPTPEQYRKATTCVETRNKIALYHMPLVQLTVSRMNPKADGMDDLVQAGFIGLLRAVERYDVDQGHKFSTYAVPWIKQAVSSEMHSGRPIRVPDGPMRAILAIRRGESFDDVVSRLKVKPDILTMAMNVMNVDSLPEWSEVSSESNEDSTDIRIMAAQIISEMDNPWRDALLFLAGNKNVPRLSKNVKADRELIKQAKAKFVARLKKRILSSDVPGPEG